MTSNTFIDTTPTAEGLYLTASASYSNTTNTSYPNCEHFKKSLIFDMHQGIRVMMTWLMFLMSAGGNLFILYCVLSKNRKSHVHVITMHLVLANLVFTCFSMPTEAIWNVTMSWKGGTAMCKICQMLKQFGMYVSSLMVLMIAADRAMSILAPMANANTQRKRIKFMLVFTWIISFLFAVPAAVFFDLTSKVFCEGDEPFNQCVDFAWIKQEHLKPYYVHTMCWSFIVPFFATLLSYSLVLCEINSMQVRDIRIVGRRASKTSNIAKARRKTFLLMSMVSLAFILFWGPYYAAALVYWFRPDLQRNVPKTVSTVLYLLLYLNPTIHPFIYGTFMRDVRAKFFNVVNKIFCLRSICQLFRKKKKANKKKTSKKVVPKRRLFSCATCCGDATDDVTYEQQSNMIASPSNRDHVISDSTSSSSQPNVTMVTRAITVDSNSFDSATSSPNVKKDKLLKTVAESKM